MALLGTHYLLDGGSTPGWYTTQYQIQQTRKKNPPKLYPGTTTTTTPSTPPAPKPPAPSPVIVSPPPPPQQPQTVQTQQPMGAATGAMGATGPTTEQIIGTILSMSQQDTVGSYRSRVRDIFDEFSRRIPQPRLPTLEQATAQIMAALQPIMERAQQQASQDWARALGLLQATAASRGLTGSAPAIRAMMDEAARQQQVQEDIAARFGALASEQAMAFIGQQLGAYQTMQQAQQEAIRNAALLTEMFQQARLSEVQTRLGALLDTARLQEAARQANLPYQFPTADTQYQALLALLSQLLQGQQFMNIFGRF